MELWEYVLAADDERDLSDPKAARAWLESKIQMSSDPNAGGLVVAPVKLSWGREDSAVWTRNLIALRSLAHRLRGRKPKHNYPTDRTSCLQADEVFRFDYLLKLRVQVDAAWENDTMPLARSTFRGLKLCVTQEQRPDDDRQPRQRRAISFREIDAVFHWLGLDVFWQSVFCSLVREEVQTICLKCGKTLGMTRKGYRSRRRTCPRCNLREWRAKQKPRKEKRHVR